MAADVAATGSAPALRGSGVPRSYAWVPTVNVEIGMVVGRPMVGGSGSHGALQLATGTVITASTLSQLINKGVECIAVQQDTPLDADTYAAQCVAFEARLDEIFGSEPDPSCRDLLAAMIQLGP